MFGLSDKRIWILARDQPWTQTSGSYLYEEGMIWPGFKPPVNNATKFVDFGIVQLPSTENNKDRFFISGGIIDGAPSTRSFVLNTMVNTSMGCLNGSCLLSTELEPVCIESIVKSYFSRF